MFHSSIFFRRHAGARALLHVLGLLVSLHLLPGVAVAQGTPPSCTEEPCGGTGDTTEPGISFSPASGTYSQASIPVVVTFTDGYTLDDTTRILTLNNGVVTTGFEYGRTSSAPLVRAQARGTITLQPGSNVLSARICDRSGHCETQYATYAFGVPGVSVTPDGNTASAQAGGAATQAFTVTNTGPAQAAFSLQAACRQVSLGVSLSSCSAPASTNPLNPGASQTVTVSYTAGASGNPILVELRARLTASAGVQDPGTVQDAGWVEVDVHGTAGSGTQSLGVSLVDLNSSTTVSREECVTVSAGVGAAYECGDLRLVHGVPGMMTLGRPRAPVLLYNSQHANVRPVVYADVTRPSGTAALSEVVATVQLANGTQYTRRFAGSDWQPGSTRRIGVQWDGLSNSWGLMPYTLQVAAVYSGGAQPPATLVNGEMMVTNRADSPLGQGWWLAGMEFIACFCQGSPTRMAHWSGDGSMRVYQGGSSGQPWDLGSTWVAQNPAGRPDTLVKVSGGYVRRLQGGGEIHFDDIGRHVRTVSRLRDTTHFAYDGSSGVKVTYVSVPRRDGQASGFRFTYTGGYVSAITPEIGTQSLPGITIGRSGGRITSITDPDNLSTQFGYGDPLNPNRVTSRTSRDGTVVSYGYDGVGKLSTVTLALSDTASIVTGFTAAESRGVHPHATDVRSSVAVSQAYTLLDGPRTDVVDQTRIWVTARGAPRRIRDALGNETVLNRTETGFPSLVTEVRGPDTQGNLVVKSRASYDGRGRVDTATVVNPFGNGVDLVTRYAYDDRWDAPDTIWSPGVAPTAMAYDTVYGNVIWQQQGGPLRRVYMDYGTTGQARGLLTAVRYPHPVTGPAPTPAADTIVDRMGYDGAGNLQWTRTPLGFLTHHVRDTRGRDSLTYSPVHAGKSGTLDSLVTAGVRTRTSYDVMGRVKWTESTGPAVHLPAGGRVPARTAPVETVRVETDYDAMGRPQQVTRWSTPDSAGLSDITTQYGYDRAGRKTREYTLGAGRDSTIYDRAGNAVAAITARNHRITMSYDALNRLVRRDVPSAMDNQSCIPGGNCANLQFPLYPSNAQGGFTAPAETFLYRYDAPGNQVYAENLDARVSRGYYPGGALRADTTRMRSYAGMDYPHVFGLEYRYDDFGRLRALQHPGNLAASTAQSDTFVYNDTTGALRYARSRLGQGQPVNAYAYRFEQDLLGRTVRTAYPGDLGGAERITYDRDSRRLTRVDSLPSGVLAQDAYSYDARGKTTFVSGSVGSEQTQFHNWYSGLGNLLGTDWGNPLNGARTTEVYSVDAMGNQVGNTTWQDGNGSPPSTRTRYAPGTGRIMSIGRVLSAQPGATALPDSTYRHYDDAGNVTWGEHKGWGEYFNGATGINSITLSRNYFGADQMLRVVQVHDETTTGSTWRQDGSFAEYRYDPLGRRIMERTRRPASICFNTGHECLSTLTRFVWAGDQLLWELRVPGGDSVPAASTGLDATSASGDFYGRVSYFHAGGIDKPLLITKEGAESVVPRETWRGQFHAGTSPTTGARRDCPGGVLTNCLLVPWPGMQTNAAHSWGAEKPDIRVWYGGLVDGMRDASGQMYMRNRYYDPATGQFTQTDPIGIAGGLNAYGFAAGDPVSYSDPYGLAPDTIHAMNNAAKEALGAMVILAALALNSEDGQVVAAGQEILTLLNDLHGSSENVYFIIDPEMGRSATGPMDPGPGIGSLVNPNQSTKRPIPVRSSHELGHAWAMIFLGATDKNNPDHARIQARQSLRFENAMRTIYGCTHRRVHGTDSRFQNPACRFR